MHVPADRNTEQVEFNRKAKSRSYLFFYTLWNSPSARRNFRAEWNFTKEFFFDNVDNVMLSLKSLLYIYYILLKTTLKL